MIAINKADQLSSQNVRPVCIIILAWNALDYTKKCLATLRETTVFPDYRVIVVDNGSSGDTADFIKTLDWVELVRNEQNEGFARGNNAALRICPPGYDIILLNNDTEIRQADWITRMQKTAYDTADTGIVGCRLRRPNGILQHAGVYMPPTYWGQQIGSNEQDINQYNTDREVESVVFACAYIKREVLDRIGLLDERYISYFEDTDYCLKAREAGYRVVCCGSVTIMHHENITTTVNGVHFGDLFEKSAAVFRKLWKAKIEKCRHHRKLAWHSLINFESGYAISSRQLMLAMDKLGLELSYKYVYGPGTPFPLLEPETSDNYMTNVIRQRPFSGRGIQVVYGQGDVFGRNTGDYKIGYTMLETDRIPDQWVAAANRMDEVWVTSAFNEETFRQSGVTRPIHIIPLGIDPDYFNPSITSHRIGNIFTFLSVFEWGERKAPELLLKAFSDEFRRNEDVVLICKTSNSDGSVNVAAQVRELNLKPDGGRIVFSLNEIIPTYQLSSLYRSADCFVLPTRGEGWGMPILEAMACGLPVIATDWSSHRDFMNSENAYPISVEKLIPAEAKCPYYKGFNWAQPSYDHLRSLMRHVYENREEARAKGERACRDAHEKWTWHHSAQRIMKRLEEIEAKR
ncbi:MAG: glycosyltransferase [Chthoniobacteraceae bacterium]